MSIDVIRDVINLDGLIKRLSTQAMVTGDILIPDTKPDAADLIGSDSQLIIDSCEVTSGRILVEGRILSNLLYATAQTDLPVSGMSVVKEFSHYFDVADVEEETVVEAKGYVEHTDCEVLNSRKFQFKHMVHLDIFLSKRERVEAVSAIDSEDTMTKRGNIRVKFMVGEGSSETIVREDLSPGEDVSIREVLYASADVIRVEPQISENKVLVECTLNVDVIYLKDTEEVEYDSYSTDINFSHFVDIADVHAFMSPEVKCVVEEVNAEPKDSSTIGVEAVVDVRVKVFEENEKTIIKDAYSIIKSIKAVTERFAIFNEVFRSNTQISLKETIEVPDDIKHILAVRGQAQPGEHELSDKKLYLDGLLLLSIYFASDSGINYYLAEIPFRHVVDADEIKEGDDILTEFNVSHVSFALNGGAVDVRYTIDCDVSVYRETELNYISSVEESEDETLPEMASITIYVADKDETLWDVAKRYRTTSERIMQVNGLTEDKLEEGDKLIVIKESRSS